MEKTMKDLSKLGNSSMYYAKKAIYYGYIPLIVYLGLKTTNLSSMFTEPPPMWHTNQMIIYA